MKKKRNLLLILDEKKKEERRGTSLGIKEKRGKGIPN